MRRSCLPAVIFCLVLAPVPAQKNGAAGPDDGVTVYKDVVGHLRMAVSPDTGLLAVNGYNGNRSVACCYGSRIIRRTYDTLSRLCKTEIWKTGAAAEAAEYISVQTCAYRGNTSMLQTSSVRHFPDGKLEVTAYDARGRREQYTGYHIDAAGTRIRDSSTKWSYDSRGRVAEQISVSYLPTETVRKTVYSYPVPGREPDCSCYENGTIRIRRVYTDTSRYTETLYFDGGYSVENTYEHGIKSLERFLLNGREIRRNNNANAD